MRSSRALVGLGWATLLAACATQPGKPPPATSAVTPKASPARSASPYPAATEDPAKRGDYTAGGLYAPGVADSAPADVPDVDRIPEPVPDAEPRSRYGNRDYSVLGKRYRVLDTAQGYHEIGLASYYGSKFHRRRTSSLEVYDMYAFTAAHRTLPLPSFVRVTNLDNGKSVVVRVNDRGPFHSQRIIDLSYAAAVKLDMLKRGTARVDVVALQPGQASGDTDATARQTSAPATMPISATPTPAATDMDRWTQAQTQAVTMRDSADSRGAVAVIGTPPPDVVPASVPAQSPPAPPVFAGDGVVVASASTAGSAVGTITGSVPAVTGDGDTWQLASYRGRAIAEHALLRVQSAGITQARLEPAQATDGSPRWRLRLGPLPSRTERERQAREELRARLTGLGFTPILVTTGVVVAP